MCQDKCLSVILLQPPPTKQLTNFQKHKNNIVTYEPPPFSLEVIYHSRLLSLHFVYLHPVSATHLPSFTPPITSVFILLGINTMYGSSYSFMTIGMIGTNHVFVYLPSNSSYVNLGIYLTVHYERLLV